MTLTTETLFPGAFVVPITSADDGIGRKISRTLKLPAGRYTLSGVLELAPTGGLVDAPDPLQLERCMVASDVFRS